MFDLFIKNGQIINGTGSPPFYGNIGVKDAKISYIGKCVYPAKETVDATSLIVTPGFIDSHSHSDYSILTYPDMKEKAEQGITTSVCGNCGISVAPVPHDIKTPEMIEGYGLNTEVYKTVSSFLSAAEHTALGSNNVFLIGHGSVRKSVIGMENRKCTDRELAQMKEIVSDGLDSGAAGVSFGLFYTPGNYADIDELIEIAKVCAAKGKVITAHIRNESDTFIEAVGEFLKIAEASGARAVFSHHKSFGKKNWGKVNQSLGMIDEANKNGLDVYLDVYPYTASSTSLSSRFIPQKYHALGLRNVLSDRFYRDEIKKINISDRGEDLSWVLVTSCPAFPEYEGKDLNEIALIHKKDVYETVFDLIEGCGDSKACYFTMCEKDVKTVMAHPRAMICTDSNVAGQNKTFHPRLKGTFPRVLGKYVREEKVTSLSEMVRKITSMPASVYSLKTKGLIWEGMDADICIFDAAKIADKADYVNCRRKNEGLNYVIVGGKVVVRDAEYLNKRNGKLILEK